MCQPFAFCDILYKKYSIEIVSADFLTLRILKEFLEITPPVIIIFRFRIDELCDSLVRFKFVWIVMD